MLFFVSFTGLCRVLVGCLVLGFVRGLELYFLLFVWGGGCFGVGDSVCVGYAEV